MFGDLLLSYMGNQVVELTFNAQAFLAPRFFNFRGNFGIIIFFQNGWLFLQYPPQEKGLSSRQEI